MMRTFSPSLPSHSTSTCSSGVSSLYECPYRLNLNLNLRLCAIGVEEVINCNLGTENNGFLNCGCLYSTRLRCQDTHTHIHTRILAWEWTLMLTHTQLQYVSPGHLCPTQYIMRYLLAQHLFIFSKSICLKVNLRYLGWKQQLWSKIFVQQFIKAEKGLALSLGGNVKTQLSDLKLLGWWRNPRLWCLSWSGVREDELGEPEEKKRK